MSRALASRDVEKQLNGTQAPSPSRSESQPGSRDSVADDVTVVEHAQREMDQVEAPGEPPFDKELENSPYLVRWDGPDDPENPKVSRDRFSTHYQMWS